MTYKKNKAIINKIKYELKKLLGASSQLACLQGTHPHPQAGRGGRPGDGVALGVPSHVCLPWCSSRGAAGEDSEAQPTVGSIPHLRPCISTGFPGSNFRSRADALALWDTRPIQFQNPALWTAYSQTLNSCWDRPLVQLKSRGNTLQFSYVETFFFFNSLFQKLLHIFGYNLSLTL